jgi:hypothetical protein
MTTRAWPTRKSWPTKNAPPACAFSLTLCASCEALASSSAVSGPTTAQASDPASTPKRCACLKIKHLQTRPYTPKAERFVQTSRGNGCTLKRTTSADRADELPFWQSRRKTANQQTRSNREQPVEGPQLIARLDDGSMIYVEDSGVRFGPPVAMAHITHCEPVDPPRSIPAARRRSKPPRRPICG